jgi:hypothetical protein
MTDPLFVDLYPLDGPKDWNAFIAAGPPWHGAVFKLSQGLRYEYSAWALDQRKPFLHHARYGRDLFDGFYHYLDIGADGAAQAQRFCQLMETIGGEHQGTLWGMVDVERGGQRVPLTPQRVRDCVTSFAEEYFRLTGRRATLYGGELLRAIRGTGSPSLDLMGCGRSWVALYGPQLHGKGESTSQFLARTGTDLQHLMAWQYDAGDDEVALEPAGYPNVAPGCGKIDISALVMPGGLNTLRARLWAERP